MYIGLQSMDVQLYANFIYSNISGSGSGSNDPPLTDAQIG